MRVSVVLPIFNEQDWMHIALNSLNDQTIPFELIVVDNGSTDRTGLIAREYTPWVFSAPRGKLNAKQLGVYEASGDVVVMADADCFYPPNFLETLTKHFNDPNVVMVTGVAHGTHVTPMLKAFDKIRAGFNQFVFKYSGGPVTAYRREAFLHVGGYNLNVNQFDFVSTALEEEIKINWRMAKLGRIVYEPKAEALHFDRRGLCAVFGDKCPIDYESVCVYCKEILYKERF